MNTLPFLFVSCNFLYVNFSTSVDKLIDDDDDAFWFTYTGRLRDTLYICVI